MKATIDVPDDIYRRVKAKTALQGRAIREVTVELYEKWLNEDPPPQLSARKADKWLEKLMLHSIPAGLSGPTAREILDENRKHLDPSDSK